MSNCEKILIIGPAWVGDMMMAQSLFKLLKSKRSHVEIHVLAPEWTKALLSRMPEVSRAIAMPLGHGQLDIKLRFALGRSLKAEAYDQAIVLPNSWKSALVPFFAGIKRRTGWCGEMRYGLLNDLRRLDESKYPLMIERFMALGLDKTEVLKRPYYEPELAIDEAALHSAMQTHRLNHAKPIVALAPGAEFGPSKRWPAEYFAEVANTKLSEGYQVWLFGSKNDQPIADEIQTQTGQACVNLIGKTSLAEAIDLLSLSELLITNDSGLMHIGAALQKPLVAVYGSTSPKFTPPLGKKQKILQLDIECSPCFKRECPLGHWRCMRDLKPEQVIQAVTKLDEES